MGPGITATGLSVVSGYADDALAAEMNRIGVARYVWKRRYDWYGRMIWTRLIAPVTGLSVEAQLMGVLAGMLYVYGVGARQIRMRAGLGWKDVGVQSCLIGTVIISQYIAKWVGERIE